MRVIQEKVDFTIYDKDRPTIMSDQALSYVTLSDT